MVNAKLKQPNRYIVPGAFLQPIYDFIGNTHIT